MTITPKEPAMDRRDFAIGILTTTAVILAVGLVLLDHGPTPAFAGGPSMSAGNYVVTVGRLERSQEDIVYVLNSSTRRMASYRFDPNRGQIELVQGIDLARLLETGP